MSFRSIIIENLNLLDYDSDKITIYFTDGTCLEECYPTKDLSDTAFLVELETKEKAIIFTSSISRIEECRLSKGRSSK